MQLIFDSVDEVRDFVKNHLKGSRSGKDKNEEGTDSANVVGTGGNAPAPIMPPAGGGAATFNPGGGATSGFGAQGGGFPSGPSPEVLDLVKRVTLRLDAALASGQPADAATNWFRQQCGPEAANATLDQIKATFLPKLAVPQLQEIARYMGA